MGCGKFYNLYLLCRLPKPAQKYEIEFDNDYT